ncbi:MAG: hypothetical protein AB7U85_02135 [Alphaproteobacteria bacterium]
MGSFFSVPSTPSYVSPTAETTTEIDDTDDSDDSTSSVSTVERNRKGLAQNIKTSWRGVLNDVSVDNGRKNLLGE